MRLVCAVPLTKRTRQLELGEGFPEEFSAYLAYARKLGFEETPDYDYLRGLMSKVLQKINEVDDGVFDFMLLGDKSKRRMSTSAQASPLRNAPTGASNMVMTGSMLMPRSGAEPYRRGMTRASLFPLQAPAMNWAWAATAHDGPQSNRHIHVAHRPS